MKRVKSYISVEETYQFKQIALPTADASGDSP